MDGRRFGTFSFSWNGPLVIALCIFVLILAAAQTTVANLPTNKIFAGHDSGFYNLFPDQLIRTSSGTWEVKTDLGFPNFQAMGTLPYALIIVGLHHLQFDGSSVGRILYFIELLAAQLGAFGIAWLVIERSFTTAPPLQRGSAALLAALAAGYNIFTAVLLLYPPSGFQFGILLWPVVIAFELYFLWRRPVLWAAILFALALWFATIGNPATTLLGMAIAFSIYAVNGVRYKAWHLRYALVVAAVFSLGLSYLWMPALAALLLYHGAVSAPEGADPAALLLSQQLVAARDSLAALIRFDGLQWWPKVRNADLYNSLQMIIASYVPIALAIVALLARTWFVRISWVALIATLWFAKSVHPPLALNMIWLMNHVPLLAAFRETYDKFMMALLILLPPLSAYGVMLLWRRRSYGPHLALAALILVAFATWPFLSGRVAEPYFLTTIPTDYRRADAFMGRAPDTRVLSLPGAPGGIHVTDWFKGGNFETLLYHAKVLNAAVFKERSISAAPYYDDYDLVQPSELPDLIGALGIYHVNFIILHKDYLTSYRMAFDYQRSKVLGPQVSAAAQRVLDHDARLERIYEGSHLILYRVRSAATLPYAYGTYDAGLQIGFENTLLGTAQASILNADRHPLVFFSGNLNLSPSPVTAVEQTKLLTLASFLVQAPLIPETPALYREQMSLDSSSAQRLAEAVQTLPKPTYFIFEQPRGDWLSGRIPPQKTLNGVFDARFQQNVYPRVTVSADRVPRDVAFFRPARSADPAWVATSFARELNVGSAFSDGRPPGQAIHQGSVQPRTQQENSAASYDISPTQAGDTDELMIAHGPTLHVPMINDPRVSFDYAMTPPQLTDAWLRFEMTTATNGRVYLDRRLEAKLDGSGTLENYDVRDALQASLDRRFDELLQIHETDPQWIAAQPRFNPEQAEDYTLTGISLIFGKGSGADATGIVPHLHFDFRDLRIFALGEPAYRRPVFHVSFLSKSVRLQTTGFRNVSSFASHGALIVSGIAQPLSGEPSPVGHMVTFAMKDGSRVIAHVLSETPEYYTAISGGLSQLIVKGSIDSILAVGSVAEYRAQVNFKPIDPRHITNFRVRYLQESPSEQVTVSLLVALRGRTSAVVPGLALPTDSATLDTPPAEWTSPTSFPGTETPILLNSRRVVLSPDTGWRQLSFDLRRVAAFRIPDLSARVVGVQIIFGVASSPSESNFTFGLGDIAGFEQVDDIRRVPPAQRSLSVDGQVRMVRSTTAVGGDPSVLTLTYDRIRLAQGEHRIITDFDDPWTVRSAILAPSYTPATFPVAISHVDDELYSLHLSNDRPGWLAFAETFHEGWKLVPGAAPQSRWQWLLSLRWLHGGAGDHLVGNAYNNAWRVQRGGDYVLDFAPQDFAIIGEALSLGVLLLALITALISALRPRRRA